MSDENTQTKISNQHNIPSRITGVRAPYTLLLLCSISLIVVSLIVWSFNGRISETVVGNGIIVSTVGSVMPVVSMGDGVIENLNIKIGSKVRVGQMLGQLFSLELPHKIDQLDDVYESFKKNESLLRELMSGNNQTSELEQEEIRRITAKIEQEQQFLDSGKKQLSEKFWIHSSFEGEVIELLKNVGEFVRTGEKIAVISPNRSSRLYLVAYIPFEYAQRVKNGMRAYFSPNSLSASKYGYMKCIVRSTNSLPISSEAVETELMNKSLQEMMVGAHSVARVELELIPDKKSENGYGWTSTQGMEQFISRGMVGSVVIDTSYKSPISLVISSLDSIL